MARYRQVLTVPGMAALLGISLLARVAVTAVVMALTMYVVLGLDMSYVAAGGVAAALTAGIALGSSPSIMMWGVGAAIVAGGAGIALLNPPLRAGDEADADAASRPRRRQWLSAPMIAVLTMAFGTTMLLSGIDLVIIARGRDPPPLPVARRRPLR
jgi:hypothetical protein